MPEQSRTPSKFAQVAPAHSGNTTPNIRHGADPMAETLSNLKRDALANSSKFPSLGGFAAAVEQEKLEHEAHQRGEDITHAPVRQNSTVAEKAKAREEERAAIPKPTGVWNHSEGGLDTKPIAQPAKAMPSASMAAKKDDGLHETVSNLKPDLLADSNVFPRLDKDKKPVERDIRVVEEKSAPLLWGKKEEAHQEQHTPSAWQGKLPDAVKQPGEFKEADTIIVDEPAERAAGIAKYKQEKEERRMALKSGPFRWFKGEPRETSLERLFVSGASTVLGVGIGLVCGVLRIFGLRDLLGRFVMGCRNFSDRLVEGTFLRHFRNYGHQWSIYRLCVRIIQNIDRNVRRRIGPEPGKNVEEAVNEIHREGVRSWETAKREVRNLRDETANVISEARTRVHQNVENAKKQQLQK